MVVYNDSSSETGSKESLLSCGTPLDLTTETDKLISEYFPGVKFQCEYCGQIHLIKKYLKEHHKLMHSEDMYECETCQESFPTKSELKRHEHFFTLQCRETLEIEIYLKELDNLGKKDLYCESCNVSYKTQELLHKHFDSCPRGGIISTLLLPYV